MQQNKPFYISEDSFRVWLPDVLFKSDGDNESFDSRKLEGIMSTDRRDRQGEVVTAKGLDFSEFLHSGHFNDNHSQETSAIVGYPQATQYHKDLGQFDPKLKGVGGWTCKGYILKGTKRADGIWELAEALQAVPNKKLGFSIEGKVTRRANKTIESAKIRNVAITNCFPGDVRVVGAADKVTRRFYSGPMIEIHLSTGEKLTGTPNHPIFTQRGWIALGELDEVKDRVGRFDSNLLSSSMVSNDVQNMPATFEEIFNSSRISGTTSWVGKAGKGNFHGDGLGGDVDVVLANGSLRDCLHTAFLQKFGKDALPASDKIAHPLAGLRSRLNLMTARLLAASRLVGGFGKQFSLAGGPSGVFQPVFFLNGPGNTSPLRDVVDGVPGHSIFGSDKSRRLSKAIGFGNITFKRSFDFSGHVYNLDTTHGWYEANGIIGHNCPVNTDCTWDLLAKSFVEEEVAMKSLSHEEETDKALSAGSAVGTDVSGGSALRTESLDSKPKDVQDKKKSALKSVLQFDEMLKAMDVVLERRPDFDEEAAAVFVNYLFKKGGSL